MVEPWGIGCGKWVSRLLCTVGVDSAGESGIPVNLGMDSVRFGRVLGKGARAAAKGLYEAVDAATAPNPNPPQPGSPRGAQPVQQQRMQAQTPLQAVTQGVAAYQQQKKAVTREAGKLGKSFLKPFARAGGVLWLEVTGTFFALFALIFGSYTWKYRGAMRLNATNLDAHHHFVASAAAAAVFGYFAVSSFVRARRRERAPR